MLDLRNYRNLSFVPPLIYSVLGSSRHLAVGPVSIASIVMGTMLNEKVSYIDQPTLYLHRSISGWSWTAKNISIPQIVPGSLTLQNIVLEDPLLIPSKELVYSQVRMEKFPETFEQFTTKSEMVCTLKLDMLCISVNTFVQTSMTEINTEVICKDHSILRSKLG
ncbi:hypothetical protein POM88_045534 [Heracleum sosnowskyi]|uniref:SLC26A/SulP transporter domain-containing protein n=1 Tax=Heracleum sosnowskyi TaxID=360622 RepID=A0AAD8H7M9_9APIA|nr:hypothetical protein POM88_045534 [Heracleum sosnowskyi]